MHRRLFLAGSSALVLPSLLQSRRSALAAGVRELPVTAACEPQDGCFEDEVLEDSAPESFPEFHDDWDSYLYPSMSRKRSPIDPVIPPGHTCPRVTALERAADVLRRVPVETPFESSDFLAGLQDENEFGERYNAVWDDWWNPVIVWFFRLTSQHPQNDETYHWCAAYMNWLLNRNGLAGTGSAAALSFDSDDLGPVTEDPHLGDVVVLERKDKEGKGHVGLYVEETQRRVLLLGGNQRGRSGGPRRIGRMWYPKDSDKYRLRCFRSIADWKPLPADVLPLADPVFGSCDDVVPFERSAWK